jgi:hypothetical protein
MYSAHSRGPSARRGLRLAGALVAGLLLVGGAGLVAGPSLAAEQAPQHIALDLASGGRTYEGMGAISGGGGTSRLLVDYPEPQRSRILDYLFKPGYGASLEILKVEIGGDTHSSNGAEPSHMRTRDDLDCNRGYEWWLMEEAKKRNPDIVLYGLSWGAPGWFEGGYWSKDSIDYHLAWLDCAKQHHLTIDYVGGRNEREPDLQWYVDFKKALVAGGYTTKLVASDTAGYGVVTDLKEDQAFRDAVDVVGVHYPCSVNRCTPNADAMALGKPLWASESGWNNYLTGARRLGSEINHQYVDSRMTAFINWPAIYSWYPTVQYQNSGLMKANEPWSGAFDLGPSLWAVAQTSQFADPGWTYVDSGSTYLAGGGTSVLLAAPAPAAKGAGAGAATDAGRDWSAVIETTAATAPQTVTLDVRAGLSRKAIQQWSTVLESGDDSQWFAHETLSDSPDDGEVTVTLQPGRVYTFTTRTDGHKGDAQSPKSAPMGYFAQSFNGFPDGVSPTWFSDMEGAFETAKCRPGARPVAAPGAAGQGKCLEQVITEKPEVWMRTPYPVTLVGDITWKDYEVSTDALMTSGSVALAGRITNEYNSTKAPRLNTWMGYYVWVSPTGAWRLEVNQPQGGTTNGATKVLASGQVDGFDGAAWHRVALRFDGDRITPVLDGSVLATVTDSTYANGQTGLAVSDYATTQFDNYSATAR